jgi:hypothetical protein
VAGLEVSTEAQGLNAINIQIWSAPGQGASSDKVEKGRMASWANAKRQLVAWSALLAGSCGHGDTTTPIHEVICRALPTRIFWIDESLDCRRSSDGPAAPFDVSCSGSRRSLTTTYPNLSAVTAEKLIPNRTYAVRRTFGGCGSFATLGCATSAFIYEYDAGRLRRRRLTFSQTLSPGVGEVQAVDFSAWDLQGRPTRAVVREAGFETAVTIAYDDPRRTESWSNGEQRVRDADANIIREVTVSRDANGSLVLSASDYTIQATEPTCTDPPGPPIG